ncbi:hypothetical protein H9Q10_00565 [Eikenella sp. S3360]|uniref:Uncharacterized protein n=1 Tax=Eikenella glucosivorans TaxID=2766967 RepID=A0ABS0N7C3_9NEIS|nr:hypothetical protein [Eikenella glucosivorans]MBH5328169.1 hypothetical protein [Eikenella glucosivorans]
MRTMLQATEAVCGWLPFFRTLKGYLKTSDPAKRADVSAQLKLAGFDSKNPAPANLPAE